MQQIVCTLDSIDAFEAELSRISSLELPVSFRLNLSDYVVEIFLTQESDTIVYTFDDVSSAGPTNDRSCWGFDYVSNKNINTISVLEKSKVGWYREPIVHEMLKKISSSAFLKKMSKRCAYGTSMGGYAASAFIDLLSIDVVLLLSPISTLNQDICPWETRHKDALKNSWDNNYFDRVIVKECQYIVAYDPTVILDSLHAKRYKDADPIYIKCIGFKHSTAKYLNELKILNELFNNTIIESNFDITGFYQKQKSKRSLDQYYYNLLQGFRENGGLGTVNDTVDFLLSHYSSPISILKLLVFYFSSYSKNSNLSTILLVILLKESPKDPEVIAISNYLSSRKYNYNLIYKWKIRNLFYLSKIDPYSKHRKRQDIAFVYFVINVLKSSSNLAQIFERVARVFLGLKEYNNYELFCEYANKHCPNSYYFNINFTKWKVEQAKRISHEEAWNKSIDAKREGRYLESILYSNACSELKENQSLNHPEFIGGTYI